LPWLCDHGTIRVAAVVSLMPLEKRLARRLMSAAFGAFVLALSGCQASIAVPPAELSALTNGEPERTGDWPTVTTARSHCISRRLCRLV